MVCPNCGSNEVIAVQGENFCINCGQLVPKVKAALVSTDGLPDGVTILPMAGELSPAPATKKRLKPGRPKAGRLDVPGAATAHVLQHAASSTPPPPARVMSDIAPPVPKPVPRPMPRVMEVAAVAYGDILAASIHGRFTSKRAAIATFPAAVLAVVGTVAGLVLASAHPGRLVSATNATGWTVYGELIIIAGIYYLIRSLSHAAITFGSARLDDHRPLATNRWLEVAADSQGRRTGLDILGGLGLAAIAALGIGLFNAVTQLQTMPEVAEIAVLMTAYASLLYLAVALSLTISLGHVAVTLTSVRVSSGLKLGWRLFRHHFELAGARIVALLVEAAALVAVGIGAGGWLVVTPAGLRPVVVICLGVVLAVFGGLAGAGTAIWWQAAYRRLVSADHPAGFHRLLSTATPRVANRSAVIAVTSGLMLLSALAVIWPWL